MTDVGLNPVFILLGLDPKSCSHPLSSQDYYIDPLSCNFYTLVQSDEYIEKSLLNQIMKLQSSNREINLMMRLLGTCDIFLLLD